MTVPKLALRFSLIGLALPSPSRNRPGGNKQGGKGNYAKRGGDKDSEANESKDDRKRARR